MDAGGPGDARLRWAGSLRVERTALYAEVRGAGPAVLLIPGGAEDAEGWRPVAERLPGRTVVTYDRRGTRRSGREDWPGGGSAQHADDAAALLRALDLHEVVVFGGSSAGIIAVQLAARHPGLIRRALAYEPGYLRSVAGGEALQRVAVAAIEAHLERHPADWAGAYVAVGDAVGLSSGAGAVLAPPSGAEWYAEREAGNAEAFVRDDVPVLTAEPVDETWLASGAVDVRFAFGTDSPRLFRDIATHLAALRGGEPDVIAGAGHAIYLSPEIAARYLLAHSD